MLVKVSQPEGLVASLEEVKQRLRVGDDETFDDEDIGTLIRAATATIEGKIKRVLLPTEYEFRASGWNCAMRIPLAPFRDVLSVSYLDENHDEQPVDDGAWHFAGDDRGGTLFLEDSFARPVLSTRPWPVRVRVQAGFDDPLALGDNPAFLPDPRDAQMVKMLVAHWYLNREAAGPDMSSIPFGVEVVAAQRRIYR